MTEMQIVTRIVIAIMATAMPALGAGQSATPPAASQNPSPMVEQTRAHERLAPREVAGIRTSFAGPQGKSVEVWVPDNIRRADHLNLVVHFLGVAWLPQYAASRLGPNTVAAVVNLGAGSGVYDRSFSDPAVFDSLLAGVAREISMPPSRPVVFQRI